MDIDNLDSEQATRAHTVTTGDSPATAQSMSIIKPAVSTAYSTQAPVSTAPTMRSTPSTRRFPPGPKVTRTEPDVPGPGCFSLSPNQSDSSHQPKSFSSGPEEQAVGRSPEEMKIDNVWGICPPTSSHSSTLLREPDQASDEVSLPPTSSLPPSGTSTIPPSKLAEALGNVSLGKTGHT
jgi:hypothetical protein